MLRLLLLLSLSSHVFTVTPGQECGIRPKLRVTRMLGGRDAHANEFPWMVSIQLFDYRGWAQNCGGVIIAPDLVLTAAHCSIGVDQNEKNRIVAGCNGRSYDEDEDGCQRIEFTMSDFKIHPKYHLDKAWYIGAYDDIGLIKLKQSFNFTSSGNHAVGPICLPTSAGPDPNVGEKVELTGWGLMEDPVEPDPEREDLTVFSRTLKRLEQTVRDPEKCVKHFAPDSIVDPKRTLCLGSDKKFEGVCSGDSGGPVMIVRDGRYYVVGIASYGKLCGRGKEYPTVFTRVSYYRDWIDTVTK